MCVVCVVTSDWDLLLVYLFVTNCVPTRACRGAESRQGCMVRQCPKILIYEIFDSHRYGRSLIVTDMTYIILASMCRYEFTLSILSPTLSENGL